jgi:hypothetical protein
MISDYFEWHDEAVAEALFFLSDESRLLTFQKLEALRSRLANVNRTGRHSGNFTFAGVRYRVVEPFNPQCHNHND